MKRIITLLTAVFCIAGLHVFAADPTEYIWYGEQPFTGNGYTPEFYIYNIGAKKFLTSTNNNPVAPGENSTPTPFTFSFNGSNWNISCQAGKFYLDNNTASCNSRNIIDVTLEPLEKCASTDAIGQVYQIRTTQKYGGLFGILAAYYCFTINPDNKVAYQSTRIGTLEDNVDLWIYGSETDFARFLLVSPEQYKAEIQRQKQAAALKFKKGADFTSYLLNPTIVQTQGTNQFMPWGWFKEDIPYGNNDGVVTFKEGDINGDATLQNWHNQATFAVDYHQTITIPAGKYRLSGNIKLLDNLEDNKIVLYAKPLNNGAEEMKTFVVRDDENPFVEFSVPYESDVVIGVKSVDEGVSGNAIRFLTADNFHLYFMGKEVLEATESSSYWENEEMDTQKEFYLFNEYYNVFIGRDSNTPVDSVEKALKFKFTGADMDHMTIANGTDYRLCGDYYRLQYSMHLHNDNAGSHGNSHNWVQEFHVTAQDKGRAYSFLTNGWSLGERYFGVGEENGQLKYAHKETCDHSAHWILVSQDQVEAYNSYKDSYDKAVENLNNYIEELGDNMPDDYYEDLLEGLNTPGKYEPSVDPDDSEGGYTTDPLEDINDRIEKLKGLHEDRETPNGNFGTICLPYSFKCDEEGQAYLYRIGEINIKDGEGEVNLQTVEFKDTEAGRGYIYKGIGDFNKQKFVYQKGNIVDEPVVDPNDYLQGLLPNHLTVPIGAYILGTKPGTTGQFFYRMAKVQNGKPYMAYLKNPESMGISTQISAFKFSTEEGDVVDRIANILEGNESPAIYDLSGRKLDNLQKGVNIVNGIKFIVK